ncbi:hypothetical protein [Streptomyces peucetius]|uniref:Uncharacterized protein n=1 Tax=Streptomyces peucetius TaxID=1950 RepID=A0ABY6IH56_STRPE|nr:hypothetical protein [Streptomyces peucetius]UYQ66333.1 hypothetical protein OGH68_36085 [Streptomyces peucetius]
MTVTRYRVLVVALVGLLAAAVAVMLAVLDKHAATDVIRNAGVAFGGTTTLGLLLSGFIDDSRQQLLTTAGGTRQG